MTRRAIMKRWGRSRYAKKERKKQMNLSEGPRRRMRRTHAYIGGRRGRRLESLCVTLGARRDAMTYRPRLPRALTSRSRSESDWEHVNSTPAITRSRPDRAATIGPPSTSPSPRLVAPARRAWSRTAVRARVGALPSQRRPEKASLRRETPVRYVLLVDLSFHFCQRGLGAPYTLFLFFLRLFERSVPIVFSFFFSFSFSGHPRSRFLVLLARTWTRINLFRRRPRPSWST